MVADRHEEIDLGRGRTVAGGHGHRQPSHEVASDLNFLLDRACRKTNTPARRFPGGHSRVLVARFGQRQAAIRAEMVVCILRPGQGPLVFHSPGKHLSFRGRVAVARVPPSDAEVHWGNFARGEPAFSIVVLQASVEERALELDGLVVEERQVVTSGQEVQILELRAGTHVAQDTAAEVKVDGAPVCAAQYRHLHVGQIEIPLAVILVVPEAVRECVFRLVGAVGGQLFRQEIPFATVWPPVSRSPAGEAILGRSHLPIIDIF